MKKIAIGAIAVLLFAGAMSASAKELALEASARATVLSSYVWRGRTVNDSMVVQPEVNMIFYPVTLNVWGTWDLEGVPGSAERTRVDANVGYQFSFEQASCTIGVVSHIFNDARSGLAKDTHEFYIDAVMNMDLSPSVTLYYDFGTIEGFYASLGMMHAWQVSPQTRVDVTAFVGGASADFKQGFFGVEEAEMGLQDFKLSVSVPLYMKGLVITPRVDFVTLLDQDLEDAMEADDIDTSSVVGSVALFWEF